MVSEVEDKASEGTDMVIHDGNCEREVMVSALETYDMVGSDMEE